MIFYTNLLSSNRIYSFRMNIKCTLLKFVREQNNNDNKNQFYFHHSFINEIFNVTPLHKNHKNEAEKKKKFISSFLTIPVFFLRHFFSSLQFGQIPLYNWN